MTPGIITDRPKLAPLKRIWPSKYPALKECALREIWSASNSAKLLPRNPAALIGALAHDLLKEAGQRASSGGFDVSARWAELADAMNRDLEQSWLEAPLVPLSVSARWYEVLKLRACGRAEAILKGATKSHSDGVRPLGTGFELWVESHDKYVGGYLDSVRRVDRGIVLSDFKSGEVLEHVQGITEKQLKQGHIEQLKLYGALYFETYGIWPDILQVVPLAGRPLKISVTPDECLNLLHDAVDTLHRVNAIVAGEELSAEDALAAPSPLNCRFCNYRPACGAYHKARNLGGRVSEWPTEAVGMVWDVRVLRDSLINLQVAGSAGEQYTFRSLGSKRNPVLRTIRRGEHVGIFNARVNSDRTEFSETLFSAIYKLPGHIVPT